jgi:uncharacterized protein YqcC (DUF446 family)
MFNISNFTQKEQVEMNRKFPMFIDTLFAHVMHYQWVYNPRYIEHLGLTDGEGLERF